VARACQRARLDLLEQAAQRPDVAGLRRREHLGHPRVDLLVVVPEEVLNLDLLATALGYVLHLDGRLRSHSTTNRIWTV